MSSSPIHSLGYLTLETADLDRWRELAVDVLGMVVGEGPDPDALYLRVDDRLAELHPAYGTVLDEACDRVQEVFDALWRDQPHPPHLLHGDVQPKNVIADGGRVTLIDFQDLLWGFEILDVVIALRHDELDADAFRAGYESVRPWPDATPETIAALGVARYLNVLNFGLSVRKAGLDEFVARIAEPVVAWMAG
jgi:Ser/Thr protein kinase RdoA (MazF antagonist)